jgi:hypothetical protein
MRLHCALNTHPQLYIARYVQPRLKKLTTPLIAFDELSNVLMEDTSEDTSMRFGHEFLSGNMEDLRNDFGNKFPHLNPHASVVSS